MSSSLLLKGICKAYGKTEVLRNVDLQVDDGEFTVFVGPSGCGKSTLLRLIAGLADISAGDMYFCDKRVNTLAPSERGIGMVFQSYALYPHMTVYQNMAFGLTLAKNDTETIEKRVMNAAQILQLEKLLERKPKELSGGQRQRVAIGRAIVRNPNVFLFDEPLSNLDAALRVQMRIEIAKLHERLGTTMIYVTHDQVEAMTMADKIVVLNAGQVEQVGAPLELYHYPQNQFVAGFIGSPKMNFLSATVDLASDGEVAVTLDKYSAKPRVNGSKVNKGDQATLGIRPEHVIIGEEADTVLTGKVIVVEHLGCETLVYVDLEEITPEPFVIKITGDISIKNGSEIKFGFNNEDCHLFDQNQLALRRIV